MNEAIDTQPVRPSEELEWSQLEAYLRPRLSDLLGHRLEAPLIVEQFPGGHSNLTYLLQFGNEEFVLRRPPFGPVPPKAHDMAREYHILAAVHPVYPLAPRPFLLCEDTEVIGSIFYVMERRRGIVVRTTEPPQLEDHPEERRRASAAMIDALSELHIVDIEKHGLVSLGKPAGFVARQVEGWTNRWHGAQTSEVPEMDLLARWLMAHLPDDPQRPTLVHGDFKLDNAMFDAKDFGKLIAVLDWEMSSVGDPLVDLGILLCYWVHTATKTSPRDSVAAVTHLPGWFSRAELLDRYVEETNFDLSNLHFYETFAVFKLAVVLQQIFYRYRRGQTDDPRFAGLDLRVEWLARIAVPLMEKD
jgi:aminoglycoside phosphotransferase (APT) family kinase protein